jgi:hypothetical protein
VGFVAFRPSTSRVFALSTVQIVSTSNTVCDLGVFVFVIALDAGCCLGCCLNTSLTRQDA